MFYLCSCFDPAIVSQESRAKNRASVGIDSRIARCPHDPLNPAPAGVGAGRTPPLYLRPGQVLRSYIAGIGELEQTFVKGD